jgi:hypothetical protein
MKIFHKKLGKYAEQNTESAALFAVTSSSSGEVLKETNRGGFNFHYGINEGWSSGCVVATEETLKAIAKITHRQNTMLHVID